MQQVELFKGNMVEKVCKPNKCAYYIPKEFPDKAPDGLCQRMPKMEKRKGKYDYPNVSTLYVCPVFAEGEKFPNRENGYAGFRRLP